MKNMSRARVIREISKPKPNAVPRVRARECMLHVVSAVAIRPPATARSKP